MTEDINFQTYLTISENRFGIYLLETNNNKVLYEKEFFLGSNKKNDFNNLNYFLQENIFNIEKLIKKFVKNINLIFQTENILDLKIGIKKKNFNTKHINKVLAEAKDLFNENFQEYKIMHIILNKIISDGKYYEKFVSGIEASNLCIETRIISIQSKFISELNNILERYQIKIISCIDEKYIRNFFGPNEIGIAQMAYKILNGQNENEALIVPKNQKNKGFFEKFFQLFS